MKILNISGQFLYECKSLEGAQIKHVNLENANLEDMNLEWVDFYGSNLKGANLKNAYLYGARLRNANLQNANLQDANLKNADLHCTNLQNANLQCANLEGAYFYNANFQGTNFHGAKINWQSRDLVAELLRRDADTPERLAIIEVIRKNRDWCWDDFIYKYKRDENLIWGIKVLKKYITKGDCHPSIIERYG